MSLLLQFTGSDPPLEIILTKMSLRNLYDSSHSFVFPTGQLLTTCEKDFSEKFLK